MINTVTNFSSSNFIFFYKNLLLDVYPADSCIYFEEEEKNLYFGNYISLVKTFMYYLVVIESRR